MTVASANTLRKLKPVEPFVESQRQNGMSFGVSHCGYDVRCKDQVYLRSGDFALASTFERFVMPKNYVGIVHDKSTWARRGLAAQNTVIEPGWEGYLTLELTNHGDSELMIYAGDPIAQIIFHKVDEEVEGYNGKYQNQEDRPVEARYE